jgi:hypothetical protein
LADHDIWYVSYRSNITPKRDDGERRPRRATRKFKAEAEAKQFCPGDDQGGLERDCRDLESPYAEEDGVVGANSQLDRRTKLNTKFTSINNLEMRDSRFSLESRVMCV